MTRTRQCRMRLVKVFLHIEQYRDDLSFDVWFTRIW
jgi:hypothetical protein